MSPIPESDAGWKARVRSAQAPAWERLAEASGGSVWERDGVVAAIVPAVPNRSIFNSVFYEDGEPLLESLKEIDEAYDRAGVRAWTVWVPEGDAAVESGLEAAGHANDAHPRDMAMALDELLAPEPDPELEIVQREDYVTLAKLNEVAWGYPAGDFGVVATSKIPGFRHYFGRLDGKDVCCLGIEVHGTDAVVEWVAALPEARGRGVSGRLLSHALTEAREEGLETTSLQSSPLGYPVYSKLGYRNYGTVNMWERRRDDRVETLPDSEKEQED